MWWAKHFFKCHRACVILLYREIPSFNNKNRRVSGSNCCTFPQVLQGGIRRQLHDILVLDLDIHVVARGQRLLPHLLERRLDLPSHTATVITPAELGFCC